MRKEKRPWDTDDADKLKPISLRLPQRTLTQLRYIADREERTKQKVIDRILLPALDHQAEELWIAE